MSIFIVIGFLVLAPAAVYAANQKFYAGKLRNHSISIISAFLAYIFIIGSVVYVETKLDNELAAFDLNGDGVFSGIEITPEQEKAMLRVTSDTGRTFAPITSAVFSVLYFLILWLLLAGCSWVGRHYVSKAT